jgi:hypothetical protein
MKFFTIMIAAFLLVYSNMPAQTNEEFTPDTTIHSVVPNAYGTTTGTHSFLGPLSNAHRRYQLLINQNQLTAFLNMDLRGFSYRLNAAASADWPIADYTYNSYEIKLGLSVPPASKSLTFEDNIAGPQTLVRSGPLTIRIGEYTSGASPNNFGPIIEFDTTYLYTGGHLLIEILHTGFSGTSSSVDAIGTTVAGYGIDFGATWATSTTATTGSNGNFSVLRITADDPIPVELTSFTANVSGVNVELNWTTATETNNRGFEIERKIFSDWENVGFVQGAGTTVEKNIYSFMDRNLNAGNYVYRLKQIDFDGTFEYSNEIEVEVGEITSYSLDQNYPNPFNPSTIISFRLANAGYVSLAVYDVLGNIVLTLLNEDRQAGAHSIEFDGSSLSSGVYYYQLKSGSFVETKKMTLIK